MDSEFKSARLSDSADEDGADSAVNRTEKVEPRNFFSRESMEISPKKKGSKKLIFIIIILVVLLSAGFLFRHKLKALVMGGNESTPSPKPASDRITESTPSPTPNPLVRSDWSLEVLNGSGTTGLAKKVADELKDLGYPVVKTGNADKSDYARTRILVKKALLDKVDLVIADLKDTIKIATVAGELKEGTASARIIIGKD